MKVEFIRLYRHCERFRLGHTDYKCGDVVDFDDEFAKKLINAGFAKYSDKPSIDGLKDIKSETIETKQVKSEKIKTKGRKPKK